MTLPQPTLRSPLQFPSHWGSLLSTTWVAVSYIWPRNLLHSVSWNTWVGQDSFILPWSFYTVKSDFWEASYPTTLNQTLVYIYRPRIMPRYSQSCVYLWSEAALCCAQSPCGVWHKDKMHRGKISMAVPTEGKTHGWNSHGDSWEVGYIFRPPCTSHSNIQHPNWHATCILQGKNRCDEQLLIVTLWVI